MTDFAQPVVVLSRCLELEPVRYNAQVIPYDFVTELAPFVRFVPVCPELEIGLGVPREPIRIELVNGEARLVQPATDRDLTDSMVSFTDGFLASLGEEVDGFILKNRSPSCGFRDVKLYPAGGTSGASQRGPGFFGGAVIERFPNLAIEDEGRLRNYRIREHFLTKLFALARLRQMAESGSMRELVRFHSEHKLILMAYSQKALRTLGRIVANHERRGFEVLIADYRERFAAALARAPRYTSVINVLQHAAGYFSKRVESAEKAFLHRSLERYRKGRMPVSGVTAVLRAWIERFDERYLREQRFFEPFPDELLSLSDSGKGGAAER